MIIHTVTPSDTIYSISKQYGIPETRIITDNFLNPTKKLVVGQNLIISRPCKTCTVRGGDTLNAIAEENNISVLSLMQNNPQIYGKRLVPSQTLNLTYDKSEARRIAVAAYTGAATIEEIEKYLPYISILLVQNSASIIGSNISVSKSASVFPKIAKKYRAVPILVIECINERGMYNGSCLTKVLDSPNEVELLINNIVNSAKLNGYAGIEINASGMNESDKYKFTDFFLALSGVCRDNNIQCSSPMLPIGDFDSSDDNIMDIVDFIPLWNYIYDDSMTASPAAPLDRINELLQNEILDKYTEKLLLGIPTFGVDYIKIKGSYQKRTVSPYESFKAMQTVQTNKFDEITRTPYIQYEERDRKNGLEHIMHFEDAQSIYEKLNLVDAYGLYGVNVMSLEYETPILWQILNQRYNILKY